MAATFAVPGSILDGMAPHLWLGPTASQDWYRDVLIEGEQHGASEYFVTLPTIWCHVTTHNRVPHLSDSFIVAKVGIRATRDQHSLTHTPQQNPTHRTTTPVILSRTLSVPGPGISVITPYTGLGSVF